MFDRAATNSVQQRIRRSTMVWLAVFLVVYVGAAVFSEYILLYATPLPLGNDYAIYYRAWEKAWSGQNPYLPYSIGRSFLYHPFTLAVVGAFASLGQQSVSFVAWAAIGAACWLGHTLLLWRILPHPRPTWAHASRILGAAIVVAMTFAPFLEIVHVGQVNTIVALGLSLAFFWSERNQAVAAGLALAVAILFKTSPALLLLYFLLTRNYRVVLSTAISCLLLTIIPALLFSPQTVLAFFAIVGNINEGINLSIANNSGLSLAFHAAKHFRFDQAEPILMLVHRLGLLVAISLIAVGYLRSRRRNNELRIWTYSALITCMVVFSPLVWYHHSVFLVLPLCLLLVRGGRNYTWLALSLIISIQLERVVEATVVRFGVWIFMAHVVLLLTMLWRCLTFNRDRITASRLATTD